MRDHKFIGTHILPRAEDQVLQVSSYIGDIVASGVPGQAITPQAIIIASFDQKAKMTAFFSPPPSKPNLAGMNHF